MTELKKDAMITFKSAKSFISSNKKIPGYTLYMDPEGAQEFAAALIDNLSEHGLRLDLFFQDREDKNTGRKFLAAFGFAKPKQSSDRIGAPPAKRAPGPVATDAQVQSQIDKIRVKAKT